MLGAGCMHLAQRYITERRGGETDDATRDVLARWESVLTRLERDPLECADELDWVAKLKLLNSYRDRDGLDDRYERDRGTNYDEDRDPD